MATKNVQVTSVTLSKENIRKIKNHQITRIRNGETCSFSKALNYLLEDD